MATVNAGQVADAIRQGQAIADLILATIEGAAPDVALEAEAAEKVVNLAAAFAATGLSAYNAANGIEITPDSIEALKANPAPLTPPDGAAGTAGAPAPAPAPTSEPAPAASPTTEAEPKPADHGTDG